MCIRLRDTERRAKSASAARAAAAQAKFDDKMTRGVKWCHACSSEKTRESFAVQKRTKDGLQSMCKACRASHYAENSKRILANQSQYYVLNADRIKAREAARYASDPDRIKDRVKQYYLKNTDAKKAYNAVYSMQFRAHNREKIKAWRDAWRAANPHKYNAYWMKRKAAKLRATPIWADDQKIEEFYFAADFLGMITGIWHEVDHVVPLQGKIVCGLHVHTNMQILTRSANRSKGHLQWPDMP